MRRLVLPLLAILALGTAVAFVPAAEIKVSENPVPANSYAEVSLAGIEAGDNVAWDVTPEPTKINDLGDGRVFFSGPCGTVYKVTADVVNFEKKTRKRYRTTVTVADCTAPQPPPVPPVPPVPVPPTPTGTPKKFVVVEDTAASGTWRGDVLGSAKVASWYKAAGMSHRLIDLGADGDDPAAVAYKKLAAGKPLPYLWICDDAGRVLKDIACPTDPDKFVAAFDLHAGKRALGALLAKPKLKWKKFGASPAVPLIPRTEWKPVNLATFLPPVYDQDGIGQCASSSACTVFECGRAQAGLPYVHVSAGDLYSRVNGGRDQGSMPEDNLNELITNGVDLAANTPYVWNGRQARDAATIARRKPNRIVEAYLCDSFDAMGSALQQGFIIQEAIQWYDTDSVDAEGWLPSSGRGGGGHALCGFGLAQRGGTWGIMTRNSWSASWGNSKDGTLGAGNCIIPESRFNSDFGSVWAVRAVYQTGSAFPAPKTAMAEPRERMRERVNPFDRERMALKP